MVTSLFQCESEWVNLQLILLLPLMLLTIGIAYELVPNECDLKLAVSGAASALKLYWRYLPKSMDLSIPVAILD